MMIDVYICEDDVKQLEQIQTIVRRYLMIEKLDMRIAMATADPQAILAEADNEHQRLYLLDIELGTPMNGIELAQKLRQVDVNCKIVFITTHAEMLTLTFKYQLEVLDFIIKDEPEALQARLIQILNLAQTRLTSSQHHQAAYVQFKVGEQVRSVRADEVLFIESAQVPHKLIVHMANAQFEYYGTIKQAATLNKNFYRCHKSIVVNQTCITVINKRLHQLTVSNGETIDCSVAASRALAKLVRVSKM
ncbi:response regulator transcription factor [Lactiplantibacillus pentosus]|uniref:LytR/AlgR family response regulator transcription factor n=1 Tax=Lactiplantibacillus pentosus TaxID=1589 RepID=UPI002090512B|nr:response regulator transcription factor [Lactiplantibacillus pentosus]WMB63517.1 response regulator transcription factor [Lactiplantibacillus pentosus]